VTALYVNHLLLYAVINAFPDVFDTYCRLWGLYGATQSNSLLRQCTSWEPGLC